MIQFAMFRTSSDAPAKPDSRGWPIGGDPAAVRTGNDLTPEDGGTAVSMASVRVDVTLAASRARQKPANIALGHLIRD
jgi:hypothetical protein